MEPLLDLKQRVALVTGAGQGIGRAIALHLAAHNAGGIIVNDFYLDRAAAVAAEIRQMGGLALPLAASVSDAAQVEEMVEVATRHFGPITILVNNAGNAGAISAAMAPSQTFWEMPAETWGKWFAANLYGVMHCCRAILPGMIANEGGRILTIGSDAGRVGESGMEAYSAAKAGAAGFMRALARSVGQHDIMVNTIALGAMRTLATEPAYADPEFLQKVLRSYTIRRLGEPGDAAAMALFLVSDAARWITGQTIAVNGGHSFAL